MVQMAMHSGLPLPGPLTGRAAVTSSVSRQLVAEGLELELPPRLLPSPGMEKRWLKWHANDVLLVYVEATLQSYIFGCHLYY